MIVTPTVAIPRRFVICLFVFIALFLTYAMRLNLSIAVVAMTTFYPVQLPNGTVVQVREFDWNPKEKGYLLSSFFYGYIVSELPAGWLSKRYGGATMLGILILCTSISTLLLPFVAKHGVYAVIIFRSVVGIFEGGSYPCTYTLFSRWAPSEEKSMLLSLSLSGPYVATAICMALYGVMAHYFGWRTLFYLPGVFGLLWVVLWYREGNNDPKYDPKIDKAELEYLQNTTGEKYEKKGKCPWKKIFTSLPVWAIIIGNVGECWGSFTMFTELPTFLNDVYKFNVNDAGMLLSIPYIVYAVGSPITGTFADYLRTKKKISTTTVRKLCNSICYFGQAVCMSLVIFSSSAFQTIMFLTIWSLFGSFVMGGYFANFLDIAPAYSGIIMGIANTLGAIAAAICPTVAGYIVTNKTKEEWNIVFLICSAVYFAAACFYLTFASGDIEEWAKTNEIEENSDEKRDEAL